MSIGDSSHGRPRTVAARASQPAGGSGARSTTSAYRCAECGWQTTKWVGRCGECQAWGTVDVAGAAGRFGGGRPRVRAAGPVSAPAMPIGEVDAKNAGFVPTGFDELDRVLGGGVVPGGVALMAGEPGIGKSTLLLAAAASLARSGRRCLYVTGEESTAQVRIRADRIGAVHPSLYLAAETDLAAVLGHAEAVRPEVVIVDSVQTLTSGDVDGVAGGVSQVRDVAAGMVGFAKDRDVAVILVGHVTKDGSVAGPRLLEHLVDVVVYFDGDRHGRLRMVRAVKNRFGPTDEVGCFELGETGITGVTDPSGLFLVRRDLPVAGTCVTVTLEGSRPLVAEVQSLVAGTSGTSPRRTSAGLESNRVAMTVAVLDRRAGLCLGTCDVYAATVGGVRITDPACDLAVALAIASAARDRPLPPGLVAIGEIGLAGDVRPAASVGRRMQEAARLGFTHALVPPGSPPAPAGLRAREVGRLGSAFDLLEGGLRLPGGSAGDGDRRLTPVH